MVCNPPAQDIEDEKFELDFSLIVISDDSLDNILGAARNVSEIEKVLGDNYEFEPVKEEEKAAVVQAQTTAKETTAVTQQAKGGEKKAVSKPVVNRTVRVDIEKLDVLMNLVSELIIAKNSLVSGERNDQSS